MCLVDYSSFASFFSLFCKCYEELDVSFFFSCCSRRPSIYRQLDYSATHFVGVEVVSKGQKFYSLVLLLILLLCYVVLEVRVFFCCFLIVHRSFRSVVCTVYRVVRVVCHQVV